MSFELEFRARAEAARRRLPAQDFMLRLQFLNAQLGIPFSFVPLVELAGIIENLERRRRMLP